MRLSELIKDLSVVRRVNFEKDEEIAGVYFDSREVQEGGIFVCLSGSRVDGHKYAAEAIRKGATVLLTDRELAYKTPQIIVENTRLALSMIAAAFYGYPSRKLRIIGITGTNGKTTTAYILSSILRRAGYEVGTIGTLGVFYGKKCLQSELTTPDPVFLQKTYADMVACGVEYVVQEVSAHALYYYKEEDVKYCAAIFTNFTQDHLDFFAKMSLYKQAKLRLFFTERSQIAIINADDEVAKEIVTIRKGENTHTYGLEMPSDCFAVSVAEGITSQKFMLNLEDDLCRVSLKMTGRHNVYNALAAASCAHFLGVNAATIAAGLNEITEVKGRLQYVTDYRGGKIFVDFAHTPDGLSNSISALKKHTQGRLICMFGCGGNRDKSKRATMGEIAAQGADFCVLTSDNPRYEEPLDILAEVEDGYKKWSTSYVVVADRKKAIEYALEMIREGDVLLLAGKGGEDTQEIMGIKHPFSDQDVVRDFIEKR